MYAWVEPAINKLKPSGAEKPYMRVDDKPVSLVKVPYVIQDWDLCDQNGTATVSLKANCPARSNRVTWARIDSTKAN
jgi:hypothetical protein